MNAVAKIGNKPGKLYAVRYASYDEGEREQIVKLYVENMWDIARFKPDILPVVRNIYASIKEGRMLVVTRADEIVGCCRFNVQSYWYTNQEMVFESGMFVVERYRKTSAGARLLNALRDEAKARDTIVIMGAATKSRDAQIAMSKRFKQISSVYMMEPPNVQP